MEPYRPAESLHSTLENLNGKDYAAFQSLIAVYAYDRFQLHIKQTPKDPYAPPGTGEFHVTVGGSNLGHLPLTSDRSGFITDSLSGRISILQLFQSNSINFIFFAIGIIFYLNERLTIEINNPLFRFFGFCQ